MSKFKVGDKVIVVKDSFTAKEWEGIGKVDVFFKIGDILTIKKQTNHHPHHTHHSQIKFEEEFRFWYPECAIELYDGINSIEDYTSLLPIFEELNIK
tara:strand:- start:175 stop:465 length:291 start_codon:yes stop_codon:yes gene_type:complete